MAHMTRAWVTWVAARDCRLVRMGWPEPGCPCCSALRYLGWAASVRPRADRVVRFGFLGALCRCDVGARARLRGRWLLPSRPTWSLPSADTAILASLGPRLVRNFSDH